MSTNEKENGVGFSTLQQKERAENQVEISKRLKAIADYVPEGSILADIGTDHGLLPCHLVLEGRIVKAYAMDIGKGPLSRAEEQIEKEGLGNRVKAILSDGFDKLPEEVTSAVVAGMGGMLMAELLANAGSRLDNLSTLVLSPHLDPGAVRKELHRQGWKISTEDIVKDNGKYYPVIVAEQGTDTSYSAAEYGWGNTMLQQSPGILAEWIRHEIKKTARVAGHLEQSGLAGSDRYRELESERLKMEEVLKHVDDGQ